MLLHSILIATVALCLLALFILPASTVAQQPAEHRPTRFLHGWFVTDFATSRNPATPHLYYAVDGTHQIIVIDSRDGRVVRNVSYFDSQHWLGAITVDSRDYVYVFAHSQQDSFHLKVFDESLQSLKNVSMASLQPSASSTWELQLLVDSVNSVYLFSSVPGSTNDGYVWVLSPRQWLQQASWKAPIRTSTNRTDTAYYVIAIDSQDYLYFQQTNGYKMLYITDQQGALQYSYQLGSGNTSSPWIDAVAIDSQGQMWHTFLGSPLVSVLDGSGKGVRLYNILTVNRYSYAKNIDVDLMGNVVVADGVEQALLILSSQTGDIVNSLSSRIPSLWSVTELLADYSGGGRGRNGGSLLFGDWSSPYVAQRMSVSDDDAGALLQRYLLPPRLSGSCFDDGVDIGSQSGNIYVLLSCFDWNTLDSSTLVYVTSQAGRAVSEFHVHRDAYRVRADEPTNTIYITSRFGFDGGNAIIAYSMADGTQLANYTTSDPPLNVISDFTIISTGPHDSALLVIVDAGNRRFVNIDTMGRAPPMSQPFPNRTFCRDITFSLTRHSAVYYVSCSRSEYVNGTYMEETFVHKWDVTTPGQPMLTDSYVPPPGAQASLAAIVVGLDQHLYAYDSTSGSIWQWRDADRVSSASEQPQQDDEPRVHVGQLSVGSAETEQPDLSLAAGIVQSSERSSHRRIRGLLSN